MIKTAVIGASGYIGSHLLERYRGKYPDCVGTSFSSHVSDLVHFDIRDPNIGHLKLEETGHQAVIITSAKPNISYCENKTQEAYEVNVRGTLNLIKNISKTSLKIIFLSTDYVFDGIEGNFNDDYSTAPTTVYGKQKEVIEKEIRNLTDNFLVLRLSKVYGLKKGDKTILDEGANLLNQNKQVSAASDQYFCPTYINDLVQAIINIQEKDLTGYMNICSPEMWSRFEMHTQLAHHMDKEISLVKRINLYDLAEMTGRPLNTSMICSRLSQETETRFISFQDAIVNVARNYEKGRAPLDSCIS
jgi:dTDP-4-dehydrorhamnose reductase